MDSERPDGPTPWVGAINQRQKSTLAVVREVRGLDKELDPFQDVLSRFIHRADGLGEQVFQYLDAGLGAVGQRGKLL